MKSDTFWVFQKIWRVKKSTITRTWAQKKREKKEKRRVSKSGCYTEILQLHTVSVFVCTSSEVWTGLLFNALKWQKRAKFLRAELEPFEMAIYLMNRKFPIRSSLTLSEYFENIDGQTKVKSHPHSLFLSLSLSLHHHHCQHIKNLFNPTGVSMGEGNGWRVVVWGRLEVGHKGW